MNFQDAIPKYTLVKEKIKENIQKGIYKTDKQLPTETKLCQEFKVSRITVRTALSELKNEGIIHTIQGKGSFVSYPKIKETITPGIKSFSEQMKKTGLSSHSKVLSIELKPASYQLAYQLDISQNDPVINLVRLRYAEGQPYQHSTSFIPWRFAPSLMDDDCSTSLFEILVKKYKIPITKSIEEIEPIIPEPNICESLNIREGTPSLLLNSHTYTVFDEIIEYSNTIIRGDMGKFVTERFHNTRL